MNTFINIGSTVFGLAAALLWLRSAFVKVEHKEKIDESGFTEAAYIAMVGNIQINVVDTILAQSRWSKWAAIATAMATLFQIFK